MDRLFWKVGGRCALAGFGCFGALLGLALLVAGCAVHSEPVSRGEAVPAVNPLQPSAREASAGGRTDGATGPLSAEQAIEEALKRSPELEQVRERINAAAEQVSQAEGAFYPRLLFSEEFYRTDNPMYALMAIINQKRFKPTMNFNALGEQQNASTVLKGEWAFFEGGSRWFDRKAALGQRRSVEAELDGARNQLVAKVTETYYKWLQALDFIHVAERSAESAQMDERLGEAKVSAQTALPSELSRLKARTAEARGNLVSARTGARRLQAAMERLMARTIRPEEVPDPSRFLPAPGQEEAPEDTEPLVRQALQNRPEMAAARALIDAARQRVRSAQSGFLPRLSSSAQVEADAEDLGGDASESWMVALQASWPLFEGGVTISRIREARVKVKELEARGEQVALDIALEVSQAALAVRDAAEKVSVSEERKKWAHKAFEEVQSLYGDQAATVDALLQAEVAASQADVAYAAALFDQKISQALLKRALGDFTNWTETRT